MGDRALGSLTLLLGPERSRPSPRTFVIRLLIPLTHDGPGESLAESCSEVWQGDSTTTCSARIEEQSTAPASSLQGGPRVFDFAAPSASPSEPEVTAGGPMTAPLMLPYGLKNAAASYASSVSTSLSAYVDLPRHHLRSTFDLIATPPASSYPGKLP